MAIGIASLFMLTGVATIPLSTQPVAHAHQLDCPNGYHTDPDNSSGCRPDGSCGSASWYYSDTGICVLDNNTAYACPNGTYHDPDSGTCISGPCGSASHYDSQKGYCVLNKDNIYNI